MSLRAILWALHDAPVEDPQSTLILVALAENAHDSGAYAWPSIRTVARKARCSERTVQRRLRDLEADGVIRRGDQRAVEHLDPRHRPVVYDLAVHRVRGDGVSPLTNPRGDRPGSPGVTPVSDKPSQEPTTPHTVPPSPKRRRAAVDGDPLWERFWSLYPKKVGKGAARTSWPRALDKVGGNGQVLVDAVMHYTGRITDLRYVPHPATWLNQERWLDDQPGVDPQEARRRRPPKLDEECSIHPGEHADACRGCAADAKARPE